MRRGTVIFDFDQTLIAEESTLAVLNLAIADKPEYKKILADLLSPIRKKYPWSAVTKAILMERLLWQVTTAAGENYVRMNAKPRPEIRDLLQTLAVMDVDIKVLSCGYSEWVTPICSAWGIPAHNVHASSLIWWRNHAVVFRPDMLARRDGKRRMISDWYKRGLLRTPVILVGDGKKELAAYEAGYGDAFVQANYFVNLQPFACSRPVSFVSDIAHLKKELESLLGGPTP